MALPDGTIPERNDALRIICELFGRSGVEDGKTAPCDTIVG